MGWAGSCGRRPAEAASIEATRRRHPAQVHPGSTRGRDSTMCATMRGPQPSAVLGWSGKHKHGRTGRTRTRMTRYRGAGVHAGATSTDYNKYEYLLTYLPSTGGWGTAERHVYVDEYEVILHVLTYCCRRRARIRLSKRASGAGRTACRLGEGGDECECDTMGGSDIRSGWDF